MSQSSVLGNWTQLCQEVKSRTAAHSAPTSGSVEGSSQDELKLVVLICGFDPETEFHLTSLVSEWSCEVVTSKSCSELNHFLKANLSRTLLILCPTEIDDLGAAEFCADLAETFSNLPILILADRPSSELKVKLNELKSVRLLEKKLDGQALAEGFSKEIIGRLNTLIEDYELLQGFIIETQGLIDQIETLALGLEQTPDSKELLNRLFGIVHTIKGASAFFEPKTLHYFFHRFEDVLKKVQGNTLKISQPIISATLKVVDVARLLLSDFGAQNRPERDLDQLCGVFSEDFPAGVVAGSISKDLHEGTLETNPSVSPPTKENSIKIDIPLLDQFLRASGEMTVVRNMVNKSVLTLEKRYSSDRDVLQLGELLEELHKVNSMLQTKITEVRKVSLKNVFKTLPRLVRDVTAKTKKDCLLKVEGDDLRVDSSIAEVLNASLSHLVRNSIDHGLETPEERVQIGKSPRGKVTIRAAIKNEQVIVEVWDDGKGINAEAIRKKILSKGIKSELETAQLTDEETYSYIFESGLSTAAQTTEISGRGVGMSAVKESVTGIGGRIRIDTENSIGTGIILELPVPKSVQIRNSLFVRAGGQEFGVAQDSIIRLIHIDEEVKKRMICEMEGGFCIRLAEQKVVPLINLSSILFVSKNFIFPSDCTIVVVRTEAGRDFGLIVDEIRDFEDAVVKELSPALRKLEAYSGATFLSDGTVGLLLSVEGIAKIAKIHSNKNGANLTEIREEKDTPVDLINEWLLFELGVSGLFAFQRNVVFRIEEFDFIAVQKSGNIEMIPYRDQILPILNLTSLLGGKEFDQKNVGSRFQALVIQRGPRYFAFKVKQIVDIASSVSTVDQPISPQRGIQGNLILGGSTVTVLDPNELLPC